MNPIFAQKALTEMCATAIYSNWADISFFEINFFGGLKLHLITKDYDCQLFFKKKSISKI